MALRLEDLDLSPIVVEKSLFRHPKALACELSLRLRRWCDGSRKPLYRIRFFLAGMAAKLLVEYWIWREGRAGFLTLCKLYSYG